MQLEITIYSYIYLVIKMYFSSFCLIFPHSKFFKHEKKFISSFNNSSWLILLKLGMVWTHSVPGGTSWVQTIPRYSKITTRKMNEENNKFPILQYVVYWRIRILRIQNVEKDLSIKMSPRLSIILVFLFWLEASQTGSLEANLSL